LFRRYVQACAVAATLAGAFSGVFACGHSNNPTGPSVVDPPPPRPITTSAVFIGAGDIADCGNEGGAPAEATARLLDAIPSATVFTAGDNAYPTGSKAEYDACYHPRWGRHRGRTKPAPGNHEYEYDRHDGGGYYGYFGDSAGPPNGYYSYDLAAWHIVVLNSNPEVPSRPGSAQLAWLRDDLTASRAKCTLAIWHHPRFTSGPSVGFPGAGNVMGDVWSVLYEFKADVVVNGHDHFYERFAEQMPDGSPDPVNGIRQFTVGTGGAPLYLLGALRRSSERQIRSYGILQLMLHPASYEWTFIPAPGGAVDAGIGMCH
jgi:hypothetical protein